MGRHGPAISALRGAILQTAGATPPAQRSAADDGQPTGTAADPYLAKVRGESFRIVDADVAALLDGGLSEDAIFELTLAVALGEATRRFEAAVEALETVAPPAQRVG